MEHRSGQSNEPNNPSNPKSSLSRREFIAASTAVAGMAVLSLSGCAQGASSGTGGSSASNAATGNQSASQAASESPSGQGMAHQVSDPNAPDVFFTSSITPEGLDAIYQAIGREAHGNVGVKVSTGEAGGNNYLKPELIGQFVSSLDGTILECNTAYGGSRSSTERHLRTAEDHGFTSFADVDIMDANGDIPLAVEGGAHLTENYVGQNLLDYDFVVDLSHFKGHAMGGFGGAIKNASIGIASSRGKSWIHTAGTKMSGFGGASQDEFLESMAEAAKSVADHLGENVIYINVMNNLSVDCDCDSHPADPCMVDIGILGSTDPVALDQACVDLVYDAEDGAPLVARIESLNGQHTLDYASAIGLGSQEYNLIEV